MENTERILVQLRTKRDRQALALKTTEAHIALLEKALSEQMTFIPKKKTPA